MREPLIFRNWRIHPSALMLMILAVIYKYCVNFFYFSSTLRTDIVIIYHQVIGKCGVQGDIYDLGSEQLLEVLSKTYPIAISLQPHFPRPCRCGSWRKTSSLVLEDAGQVLNAHKNLGESPRPRRWLRRLQRRTRLVGGLPRMGSQLWQINI